MRPSIKATLFSGLIFPGSGHFVIGHFFRGLIFALPALASTWYLVTDAMNLANAMLGQILEGTPVQEIDSSRLQYAGWIFTFCWVASIADSWRLGKIAENNQQDK